MRRKYPVKTQRHTDKEGSDQVKSEAEGVVLPQAKKCLGLPETRSEE